MFIKNLILEGFKSFQHCYEFYEFDPKLTVLTGGNNSGKSNILEAICFVLGIEKLEHIRAYDLEELIFKSDEEEVNKATVSIVFDNTNPFYSPVGYESCTEIIVTRIVMTGGKCKYTINGCNVGNSEVIDFFKSIHMDINKPSVRIMQGMIREVIYMSPLQILSLVKDVAETKNIDIKIESASNSLKHKMSKLQEMNNLQCELEKHIPIETEKKSFGIINFNFETNNTASCQSEEKKDNLKTKKKKGRGRKRKRTAQEKDDQNNVNVEAQTPVSPLEEKYKNLKEKKTVILKEIQSIRFIINDLKTAREAALQNTCDDINKNLGLILRHIFPTIDVKLVNIPKMPITDGLECEVTLDRNVSNRKEYLTDLSGEQRSVVALSFILALSLSKPAPIYLVDEFYYNIDYMMADRIKNMFSRVFESSQFITVAMRNTSYWTPTVLFKLVPASNEVRRVERRRRT